MGQKTDHEVLEAIKESIATNPSQKKEKRELRRAALQKVAEAYRSDFDAALKVVYPYMLEEELEAAFTDAFARLHDLIEQKGETWNVDAPLVLDWLIEKGQAYLKAICQKVEHAQEDSAIVRELQDEQASALRGVYAQYRDYFVGYAKKRFPKASQETLLDIYQEALIVIILYVRASKLRIVQSPAEGELLIGLRNKAHIKTLLTAIGVNMINKSISMPTNIAVEELGDLMEELSGNERISDEDQHYLMDGYYQLKEKCQFLLVCRFWLKMSYKDIQEWVPSSEEALRTMTSRCLNYLSEKFRKLRGY